MNRIKTQFQPWNIIISLLLAIVFIFSFNSPVSALSLDEFFSISYTAQFSTTTVAENATFTVTVTGTANCTKNLETPYNLVSEAVITGRIVAINTATLSKVTLNPSYVLNIKPFPTKAGESASDSQTVNLQFPAGTAPGSYRIEGELIKGEVKAIFWLDVTSYLPATKILGTVNYAMGSSQNGGGGGSGNTTPTPTPTPTPTSTPTLTPTPAPTNIDPVIDLTGKSLSAYLNSENLTTARLKVQSTGQTCTATINQDTRIQFPPGAEKIISIQTASSPPAKSTIKLLDTIYQLGPDGTTFEPPVTLTLDFSKLAIPAGTSAKDLIIASWDNVYNYWVPLQCTVNESNKTISTSIGHFSLYTVLSNVISSPVPSSKPATPAVTSPPSLQPAAFSFASISASPVTAKPGEPVQIKFNITNTGDQPGVCRVELKLDGSISETRDISLNEGGTQNVVFTITKPAAGNHIITVDKLSVSFKVVQPSPLAIFDWWLWGIIVIIAVIIGVTSVVLIRRKRHP